MSCWCLLRLASGIKEPGGVEPSLRRTGPATADHEAWKWGLDIYGAAKNIESWAAIMTKVSLQINGDLHSLSARWMTVPHAVHLSQDLPSILAA